MLKKTKNNGYQIYLRSYWFGFGLIHYSAFFGSKGHVVLYRNPKPEYDTLLLRLSLSPGDILSACPHRQFHTLTSLLDSRVTLPNSYLNALRAMQGDSLCHFYDGLWYDPTIIIRKVNNTCI